MTAGQTTKRGKVAMLFRSTLRRIAGWAPDIGGFVHDRRAVAAIEFAFIAPILLVMYFGAMEVSQAVETSKKVSRLGSMVADLVAQQTQVTKAQVEAIMTIGQTSLAPYNRSQPTIIVTGIQISTDATPKATVLWSRKLVGNTYSVGPAPKSNITIPKDMLIAGSFLVKVDSQLGYKPIITWTASGKQALGLTSAFDSISMGETYYLRPRMVPSIPCNDC
jgi:Flp pilus assembly protein TadG